MTNFLKSKARSIVNAIAGWQFILALIAFGASMLLLQATPPAQAPWLRPVGFGVLLAEALAAAIAAPLLLRRAPAGRLVSLTVNYLGFILCFLGSFQALGIFLGIDAIAATFGRGVIFLLGVFLGYLINTLGDRFPHNYRKEMQYRNAGKIVMAFFGVLFLWRINFLAWLLTVLANINTPINIGLVLGAVGMGLVSWLLTNENIAREFPANTTHAEAISGYLFLSPNFLGFLLFFAAPLLLSLYTSFTNWDAFGTRDWIGLQNYQKIFSLDIERLAYANQPVTEALNTAVYDELTRFNIFGNDYIIGAQDKLFWIALRNTLLFCLAAVPLSVIPGLLLANVLNSKIPGMKVFRALYFLPSIAAVVGVALIWQWLYNAAIGYINYFITLGVNALNVIPGLALVDPQMRWLSDGKTALLAIIIMSAWQTMGFNSVLFLAGLQNIPGELYEAATVDGAGAWSRFWKITLPMLAPTTFFVVSTTTIQALQVFEQVYIATNPPGGPNNATLTVVLYLYQNGFQRFKQGYASATAWVLFAVIFLVTLFQFQRQKAGEEAYK